MMNNQILKKEKRDAMQMKSFAFSAVVVIASLVLAACGTTATSTATPQTVVQTQIVEVTPTPDMSQPTAISAGSVAINGAGATFPFPLYSKWFYDYAFVDPSVKFNYQSIVAGSNRSPKRRWISALRMPS